MLDGDGSLVFGRNGAVRFEVSGHRLGPQPLERVRELLWGQGGLHRRRRGRGLDYAVGQRRLLRYLVVELGPYVRHPAKRWRLAEIGRHLGLAPLAPPVRLAANPGWFAGVFQADGCITLQADQQRQQTFFYPSPVLTFVNRERSLVEAVASLFPGVGSLHPPTPTDPVYRWRVTSWGGVEAVARRLLASPLTDPKRRRLELLLGVLRPLMAAGAYRPDHPDHGRWREALGEWGATWGEAPKSVVRLLGPPPAPPSGSPSEGKPRKGSSGGGRNPPRSSL
jgi:hypothetical protein